jgi:chemotaxis protein methyltransferase CheR
MSQRELSQQLLELMASRFGIEAARGRTPGWLSSRLDRAARALLGSSELGTQDIVAYYAAHPEELEQLAELVRVGETRFFRDPEQWEALAALLKARPEPKRQLSGLSAGCSTGEEAWTLAMVLAGVPRQSFRVVGVDRSAVALEEARAAQYEAECRTYVPAAYTKCIQVEAEFLQIRASIRARVSFSQADLLSGAPAGPFDVIVCKNVLIYLNHEAALRVLRALYGALAPSGVLLLARAEVAKAKALDLPILSLAPGISVFQAPPGAE